MKSASNGRKALRKRLLRRLERAWRDRNKCENVFGKAQLVKGLLSFDFWISRYFVTIFRNISTSQDAKAIELFQKFFHVCFYHVTLFLACVASVSVGLSAHWRRFSLFAGLSAQKLGQAQHCCQTCDLIFPPKTVKIEKQKTYDILEYKVLPSCKVWTQTNKKCKSSSKDAL